jgi:hypothetical protein
MTGNGKNNKEDRRWYEEIISAVLLASSEALESLG